MNPEKMPSSEDFFEESEEVPDERAERLLAEQAYWERRRIAGNHTKMRVPAPVAPPRPERIPKDEQPFTPEERERLHEMMAAEVDWIDNPANTRDDILRMSKEAQKRQIAKLRVWDRFMASVGGNKKHRNGIKRR